MGDKKLAAVGSGSGVCHGKHTGAVMFKRRNNFIGEFVAGAAGSVSLRVAALDHKIRDNPVKGQTVIKTLPPGNIHFTLRKCDKIADRQRRFLEFQPYHDVAPVGVYPGKQTVAIARVRRGGNCPRHAGN